ncbi:hypothetical protein, partial [Endozoicomonas sp.]|uniref:hypothetical protein n=1 Tax=Endozoicomonas sp. TaxID=1892382 RepID=UPI00383B95D3
MSKKALKEGTTKAQRHKDTKEDFFFCLQRVALATPKNLCAFVVQGLIYLLRQPQSVGTKCTQ